MAQRYNSDQELTLSAAQRVEMRMALIDEGKDGTQSMSDAELAAAYESEFGSLPDGVGGDAAGQDGNQSQGEAQADGESQSQGDQDSDDGESQGDQDSDDGKPSHGSPFEESDAPKPGENDSPMEDQIRQIAREEDEWRKENEIKPAFEKTQQRLELVVDHTAEAFKRAEARLERLENRPQGDPNKAKQVTVTVQRPDVPDVKVENAHPYFELILRTIASGVNLMMIGGAGAGKTTLAHLVAEALGLDFYFTGAVQMEHKLMGFLNATGDYVETQFYQAFKNGGLFLFDEMDASAANPLLAFNAALANGWADFPCGKVEKHPDFVVLAATNTFGRGADRQYVGRNQQDAAAIDRFAMLDLDYDEANEANWTRAALGIEPTDSFEPVTPLEAPQCADREFTSDDADVWVNKIQRYRRAGRSLGVRHIISPRASIMGAKLLNAGIPEDTVEDMTVWKGLDQATVDKIRDAA